MCGERVVEDSVAEDERWWWHLRYTIQYLLVIQRSKFSETTSSLEQNQVAPPNSNITLLDI
jgi:hypothetical protein